MYIILLFMEVYFSYNYNKCFSYIRKCISHYMRRYTTQYLLLLYKRVYNNNKYFSYTSSCIIHFHVSRNVYCHYITSCMMKNKYCIIHRLV